MMFDAGDVQSVFQPLTAPCNSNNAMQLGCPVGLEVQLHY
jgi:hypothetical protein